MLVSAASWRTSESGFQKTGVLNRQKINPCNNNHIGTRVFDCLTITQSLKLHINPDSGSLQFLRILTIRSCASASPRSLTLCLALALAPNPIEEILNTRRWLRVVRKVGFALASHEHTWRCCCC